MQRRVVYWWANSASVNCARTRSKRTKRLPTLVAISVLLSTRVMAEVLPLAEPRAYDDQFLKAAGHFDAGPLQLYPSLQTAIGHDDNLFESAQHAVSSQFVQIAPEVSALWRGDTTRLQAGYRGVDSHYADSSADDFTDHLLFGRGQFEAGYRHRLAVDGTIAKSHEPRGTGLTVGVDPSTASLPASPDEFTDKNAAVRYEYGAREAAGHLRFQASGLDHRYDNNRDRTIFYDRTEAAVGGTFLWRLLPRSALAIEARSKKVSYPTDRLNESTLDSREHDLLLGAEWKITELTSGSFRVGRVAKDFVASDRQDSTTTGWELSGDWAPRSSSRFAVRLDRSPQETSGVGDFVDAKSYAVTWKQQWRERFNSSVAYTRLDEDYRGDGRQQATDEVKLDIGYRMTYWLTWHVAAEQRHRNSNAADFEFERNRYWLILELQL